jgi:transaldolase/glucose-6-phosphate isomerase
MKVGNGLSLELGKHQKRINIRLKEMQDQNFGKRLWNKEEGLWLKNNIQPEIPNLSMGWLNVAYKMLEKLPMIEEFCEAIKFSGINDIVLLGMGGSSMTPLVFQKTFVNNENLKFTVLDSTSPDTIKKIESKINISKTLFIVSSKSGTTIEVMAFYHYFYGKVHALKGELAGENFIAITDEGSPLIELANKKKFRKTFINFPNIGGRYSALSYFGILPAALMGVKVKKLLERTLTMIEACGYQVPASQNPGIILGTAIAELASQGYNKLTYLLPPSVSTFGLWLEQLLAESTGKNGKGILPLNGNALMKLNAYGKDRIFFQLELSEKKDDMQAEKLKDFVSMQYPVIKIQMTDELDLGKEFFRWEIATATAGAILGINPFNQPNVQESKKCTESLLKKVKENGRISEMEPFLVEDFISYYYQSENSGIPFTEGAKSLLEFFLQLTKPGDYISIQAYLPEESEINKYILEIQNCLQNKLHLAVTTEFGPRYLHSTGQYNKGGPNTGVFIQLIGTAADDIPIPEHDYSFGLLKRAQAIGDMEALIKNKRRVILVDLGNDFINKLNLFTNIIKTVQTNPINKSVETEKFRVPPFKIETNNLLPCLIME